MKVGDKVQADINGIHSCGTPFFYSGMAKFLTPINGRDAFQLIRPMNCQSCGVKIEVYLAERSTPVFSMEQDEQNLSSVGAIGWRFQGRMK